ncbi:hypothetical protein [Hoeflea prorocentri]|uniref:Uncharacterized protein n=1 Tax=Hoeflea prorocentri TaxID=1922333 RepID=A0A9X3ZIL0_9HYPH|nr:hypothetical protein [Hoeflea prorocentri]MCY6382559.1 hypothetical protein [Hoeflea prorocentri]MDA5400359.1 hypothetical protein [Hoeflea prorocentri]
MPADSKIAQQAMDNRDGWRKHRGLIAGAICSCFVLLAVLAGPNYINGAVEETELTLRAEAAFTTVTRHKPFGFGSGNRRAVDCDTAGRNMPICLSKLR